MRCLVVGTRLVPSVFSKVPALFYLAADLQNLTAQKQTHRKFWGNRGRERGRERERKRGRKLISVTR